MGFYGATSRKILAQYFGERRSHRSNQILFLEQWFSKPSESPRGLLWGLLLLKVPLHVTCWARGHWFMAWGMCSQRWPLALATHFSVCACPYKSREGFPPVSPWVWPLNYVEFASSPAALKSTNHWEFPGGPVVRMPCSHCQGPRFNPWSGI